MKKLRFEQILNADFRLYESNPVVRHPALSTIIADPSVLPPTITHDGSWQMVCHTLFGIERYESHDGIRFSHAGSVVPRGMRPNINRIGDEYVLYYERVQPLIRKACTLFGAKWHSEIYAVRSRDLVHWSRPTAVIRGDMPYHTDSRGTAVSNPFLIQTDSGYRLYYSAGQTFIPDCGFCEPTVISYADSTTPNGDFVSRREPILVPDTDSEYLNMCCGCIKVYPTVDGYAGLQNGIYRDKDGNSHSAIMLLYSADGERFTFRRMLIEPQMCGDNDWMAQYVYACCLTEYDGKLYLYFNARDMANMLRGRENIGVAVASID